MKLRITTILGLGLLASPASALAAGGSCDVLAAHIVSSAQVQDWGSLVAQTQDYRDQCGQLGPTTYYYEGRAYQSFGDSDTAQRRYTMYLEGAGRTGRHYGDALQRIVALREAAADARGGDERAVLVLGEEGARMVGVISAVRADWYYVKYELFTAAPTHQGSLYVKTGPGADERIYLHNGRSLRGSEYSALPYLATYRDGSPVQSRTFAAMGPEHDRLVADFQRQGGQSGQGGQVAGGATASFAGQAAAQQAAEPEQRSGGFGGFFRRMVAGQISDQIGGVGGQVAADTYLESQGEDPNADPLNPLDQLNPLAGGAQAPDPYAAAGQTQNTYSAPVVAQPTNPFLALFGGGAANQAAMQANMERATVLGKLDAFEHAMERQRMADMFALIEEGAPVYRVD